MSRKLRASAFALLLLVFLPAAFSQTIDAILSGTVADPSGAVIPGATVTAVNVNTGVTVRTTANASGTYQMPPLQPGTYRISAENTGFKKAVVSDIVLGVGSRQNLDFTLEVGTITESIEV